MRETPDSTAAPAARRRKFRRGNFIWNLPSHHSITSSARASRLSGMVRPNALAVLRLSTRSYLVGACTGRSAQFTRRAAAASSLMCSAAASVSRASAAPLALTQFLQIAAAHYLSHGKTYLVWPSARFDRSSPARLKGGGHGRWRNTFSFQLRVPTSLVLRK